MIKVIKEKNGVATVIEYNGQQYILQHKDQYKRNTNKMINPSIGNYYETLRNLKEF